MNFTQLINSKQLILTEGAIVERLKSEYKFKLDGYVNHAGLIYNPSARDIMASIYRQYINIASTNKLPLMLMTPTRRANKERIQQSEFRGRDLNKDCVVFMKGLLREESANNNVFIGGLMGCKNDAHSTTEVLSTKEAYEFHSWQANELKKAGVDYLFAGIMPALSEAEGTAAAMSETGLPYIISFMLLDNGCLLDGTSINDAIMHIDTTVKIKPVGYMANCIHPTVLNKALSAAANQTRLVKERFIGLQANTSALTPKELNNVCELKAEDPLVFAGHMAALHQKHYLKIHGGCCGTNEEHIKLIASYLTNTV